MLFVLSFGTILNLMSSHNGSYILLDVRSPRLNITFLDQLKYKVSLYQILYYDLETEVTSPLEYKDDHYILPVDPTKDSEYMIVIVLNTQVGTENGCFAMIKCFRIN